MIIMHTGPIFRSLLTQVIDLMLIKPLLLFFIMRNLPNHRY